MRQEEVVNLTTEQLKSTIKSDLDYELYSWEEHQTLLKEFRNRVTNDEFIDFFKDL